MAVTTSFYPNQRTPSQASVEPLLISISVYQLVLGDLSGLRIENRYLLKAGMKITPYNLHRRLLLVPDQYQSSTGTHRIIAEAFDLIQSMFASAYMGRKRRFPNAFTPCAQKRLKGLRPVFFGPCTLRRTWGT